MKQAWEACAFFQPQKNRFAMQFLQWDLNWWSGIPFFFFGGATKHLEIRGGSRGGSSRGLQPPLWEVLSAYPCRPCLSLFHTKNNIISYNVSSSQIDHYKKTDSLIMQMQGRFSDEHRHASHLLSVVPSIIVNKALQQDDEVEGMLFWEKDIPFLKSLGK